MSGSFDQVLAVLTARLSIALTKIKMEIETAAISALNANALSVPLL
jgi:hypothetical protein